MKLSKSEKARRSTIAPKGLVEKENYYMIGDQYVRVMTFLSLPDEYGEGFLAQFMNNPNYHIDMYTEPSTLDVASAIKKEMDELDDKFKKTTDRMESERLKKKYQSLDTYVKLTVQNNTRTMNTVINIYVRASSKQELDECTKEVKDNFGSMQTGIRLQAVTQIQVGLMQKNSPLFIGNSLSKNTDFLVGQPIPSLSVAGLWPFIFDTLDHPEGTLIGREATTGGKVVFDQFQYKNNTTAAKREGITAGNMIVVGRTGMGKTTIMNLLVMGHLTNHHKVIWCDPENKNRRLTTFVNGNYIEFGKDDSLINIFDLKPITTDNEEKESDEVMYNTNNAIANVVEDLSITLKLLWPRISDDELDMLNELVVYTYRSIGIDGSKSFINYTSESYPTFTNFSAIIDERIEKYSKEQDINKKEYDALKKLQMKMRRLVGSADIPGQWSRYFNGTTSINTDSLESSGLVSIGTKSLFNVEDGLKNALLRMVINYAWATCLSTIDFSVFVSDEDHTYIGIPEIASKKAEMQRRVRKYNTVTLSGTQQVKDYSDEKIKKDGQAIFDNATYRMYFNLTKDGVNDLSELVSLSDQEKEQLENLPPYCTLFHAGNKKMVVEILATDEELKLME